MGALQFTQTSLRVQFYIFPRRMQPYISNKQHDPRGSGVCRSCDIISTTDGWTDRGEGEESTEDRIGIC